MREPLREVDANLLLSLQALLEERNLTRAGERLSLTQPAMSGALTRLRKHFDDELLVRAGREFELTPLATELLPMVADAVETVEVLLGARRAFDATTSTKRFAVSMSEYAMTVLAQPLARAVRDRAPGCSVAIDTIPGGDAERQDAQLMRRDLVIGPLGFDLPGTIQPIFTDGLVCLVARSNPRLVDGKLSLEDLQQMHHVVAEFPASRGRTRPLEKLATRMGLADRTITVTVTSLLTLPFAISGTGLCAFVPSRLAGRCLDMLDLVIAETPLETVTITEAAHWHPRRADDPAVHWLREVLYDVAIELDDPE